MNSKNVMALVDFHEGRYIWPDQIPVIAHHHVTADLLGDDSFLNYVARELKVPIGKLDSSNTITAIKVVVRDRYKLRFIMDIHDTPHTLFCMQYGFFGRGH